MTVVELGIIAAPLAGCVAAVKSGMGHGPGVVAACAVGGLVIGAVTYFGPVLAYGLLYSRVRDPDAPPDRPGAIEWAAGTVVILIAVLSPIIAWFVASAAVSQLLGSAG